MSRSFATLIVTLILSLSTGCAYKRDDRPFEVCASDWSTEQLVAVEAGFALWEARNVHFEMQLRCDHTTRGIYLRAGAPHGVAYYDELEGNAYINPSNQHVNNLWMLPSIVAHEIAHSRTGDHNPVELNLMSAVLWPDERFPVAVTDSDVAWLPQ